jgi:tetratricopeptide (TPR) repeat protein
LPAGSQTLDEARALHREGRLQEALAAYEAVAEASLPRGPASAAVARNNRCVILSLGLADYRAALGECEAALELRRGLAGEARDERGLGRTLNNLGLVLHYLGRWSEARTRFEEALALNRRLGDFEAQAINLANLGLVGIASGDYQAALTSLRQAEEVAGRHGGEPWAPRQRRVARLNRGVVFEKLGAYSEALDLYRRVAAEREAMDPGQWAALRVNMGVLYRNLGDPVIAVEAFEEAAEIYRQQGDEAGLSNALLNRALARHRNLAEPEAAEEDYRRALALARASGDRSEQVQDLFYLGDLLLEQGRVGEAEETFRRCLAASAQSGSAEGTWSAQEGLGRAAAARGDLPAALEHFGLALETIEKVRSALTEPTRRAGYFGDKRRVYAASVEVLATLERRHPEADWGEQALEIVQRAKARELLESLGPAGEAPGSLPAPLPPLELRRLAVAAGGREAPVLELFIAEPNLYAWVIRRDGIRMSALGPAAPVLAAVEEVHRALATGREPEAARVEKLSALLLGATGALDGSPSALRIAADGRLRYLPFEILGDPDHSGKPLVERLPVTYLPSASALERLEREGGRDGSRPAEEAATVVGFGDPVLPREGGPEGAAAGLLAARFRLRPLPAAAEELRRVARRLPGPAHLHLGAEATESAFREEMEQGARVVHLATHTLVDERLGRGAAVLLTPSGADDGVLYPSEIAALRVPAELTVLASCSSALGTAEDGRALTSLTGSFLAAGSAGLVATLWDVEDAATAVFMDQLYFFLGRGLPPAEALQRSKQRLRSDPAWSRTDLWSAYVLVGDPPPVVAAPNGRFWLWTALAALAAAALASMAGWAYGTTKLHSPRLPDSNPSANTASAPTNSSVSPDKSRGSGSPPGPSRTVWSGSRDSAARVPGGTDGDVGR